MSGIFSLHEMKKEIKIKNGLDNIFWIYLVLSNMTMEAMRNWECFSFLGQTITYLKFGPED